MTAEDFQTGQILLIDKPLTWTSFQVVNKVRWLIRKQFGLKKIKVGHAGTLDPLASGLLILCTGKFTKKIDQYQAQQKEYTGTITLGGTTPSYDLETENWSNFRYFRYFFGIDSGHYSTIHRGHSTATSGIFGTEKGRKTPLRICTGWRRGRNSNQNRAYFRIWNYANRNSTGGFSGGLQQRNLYSLFGSRLWKGPKQRGTSVCIAPHQDWGFLGFQRYFHRKLRKISEIILKFSLIFHNF